MSTNTINESMKAGVPLAGHVARVYCLADDCFGIVFLVAGLSDWGLTKSLARPLT
jgi:hypothetical protein